MSPFDIVRVVGRTPEEKKSASDMMKELSDFRSLVVPTKTRPTVKREKVYASPLLPGAATPRDRTWKTSVYVPSSAMRDAVSRARSEQPPLKSLETKAALSTAPSTKGDTKNVR